MSKNPFLKHFNYLTMIFFKIMNKVIFFLNWNTTFCFREKVPASISNCTNSPFNFSFKVVVLFHSVLCICSSSQISHFLSFIILVFNVANYVKCHPHITVMTEEITETNFWKKSNNILRKVLLLLYFVSRNLDGKEKKKNISWSV